jgi:hypothetical protein
MVYVFWFPYKYEISSKGLYGITTQYRWIPYFAAMLLGAFIGMKRKELKYHAWWDFVKLMLCLAVFYSIQFAAKMYRPVAPWQVVTLLPLMGITVYAGTYLFINTYGQSPWHAPFLLLLAVVLLLMAYRLFCRYPLFKSLIIPRFHDIQFR